ncbi:hypothetical protein [Deinococcus radiotolerans]|uniref:HPr kinase n=1 Tax=Deinococcus radiotolerans TaxID=1309407 RepID=A0ABQ2FJU5_9DEIO|nr:hypothetical protein [Deinococcus radiotolerans]GGL05135.1 hypothetical protein GCM10010844_24880 [Deinococcus radiotolerans]
MPHHGFPARTLDALQWDWQTERPVRTDSFPDSGQVIHLHAAALPDRPAQRSSQVMTVMDSPVTVEVSGDDLWLDDTLHVAIRDGHAHITLSGEASAVVWAVAMTEAHRAAGWLPLHAALISDGQAAVAVLGESGAGKSTACLRLRALGYQVVAEDRAWLAPDGTVTGLDRGLRAFEDSLRRFAPQWTESAHTLPRDAKGKVILPLIQPGFRSLRGVRVLGDGILPPPAARVPLTWSATGLPLTRAARQAAAPLVQYLIRDLPWQAVTRESLRTSLTELQLNPVNT